MKGFFHNKRTISVLATITLTLVGLIAVYSIFLISSRNSASQAISKAESAISRAATACAPGSEDASTLNNSEVSLINARNTFNSGSFFKRGNYITARDEAEGAAVFPQSIIEMLEVDFRGSTEALKQQDFEKVFDFCKRYPHTDEASNILAEAETVLNLSFNPLSSILDESGLKTLEKVSRFNLLYPKSEKPKSVIDNTGNMLVDLAFRDLVTLESLAKQNRTGLEKMVSTGESQRFNSLPENLAETVNSTSGYMPNLNMPAEMNQLYSRLTEANKSAVEFKMTMETSPKMLDDSDIAQLTAINEKLVQQMGEAQSLLATIKAQYFTGSEDTQAGYMAGIKAAEKIQDNY